jgi:hypothetical protein
LIGIDFQIPVVVADYFGVGVVLFFSYIRGFVALHEFRTRSVLLDVRNHFGLWLRDAAFSIFFWPLFSLSVLHKIVFPLSNVIRDGAPSRAGRDDALAPAADVAEWARPVRRWALLSLSPLFYFALLLALNFALLRVA